MKTNLLALFLLSFALLACQEDEPDGGDILQFDDYFQIVDAETGEDWFIAHDNYDPSEVQLQGFSSDGNFLDLTLRSTRIEGKNVFGPIPGFIPQKDTTTYLLSLSDTDTDTIFFDAKDCTRCEDGNYLRYESFTYYYNGEQMEYLDFRFDPADAPEGSLVYRLAGTNQSLTDSTYIMTFEKQPK